MLDFQTLYESYAGDVFRFAFWLAGEKTEAEDITSETFIRAWSRKNTIRTETLKAYLFTIARNIYLTHRRKASRQVTLEDIHTDPAPGPDKSAESRSELRRARMILETLPEIDRAAFVMRVQHELPYTEIARALDLSVGAAKVKVHRARKKLLNDRMEREVQ